MEYLASQDKHVVKPAPLVLEHFVPALKVAWTGRCYHIAAPSQISLVMVRRLGVVFVKIAKASVDNAPLSRQDNIVTFDRRRNRGVV